MKTVVIGAGLGGLAAAARLAARGVQVRVIEKNQRIGGKVNYEAAAGYKFDTGASLLTMPHVVRSLFEDCGRRLEDYVTLEKLDPICRYRWTDGTQLEASSNLEHTEAAICKIAPQDVAAFRLYLDDARRKYEVAERTFLRYSLNDLPKLLRPRYARDLAILSSLNTLDKHNRRYFKSHYLQQLFNRFATYNGSSPYKTPATFALIPFVEFGLGAWYVKGGMYELPQAIYRLATELGVEFELNTEVESIIIDNRQACGVRYVKLDEQGGACRLESRSDAVIVNADAIEAYRCLIEEDARRVFTNRKLSRVEPSCSGFVMLLGVRKKFDRLAHHNIFFSDNYKLEFQKLFEDFEPADEPTIYVCATSRTDSTQAPVGCENLFVLVNAPATSSRVDWTHTKKPYRDLIVKRLEAFGLEGLSQAIEYEKILTPPDFAEIYRAHRGAIYGVSSNTLSSAFLRPPNVARDIENLYFASGSTHPGGGIPLVLLAGKIAAEKVTSRHG